jgi:hypothetical protein
VYAVKFSGIVGKLTSFVYNVTNETELVSNELLN